MKQLICVTLIRRFNSKRTYNQIYLNIGEDKAQAQAFIDTWKWDSYAVQGYQEIITNYEGRFTGQVIELIKGLQQCHKRRFSAGIPCQHDIENHRNTEDSETDRQFLSALRSDMQPLSETGFGCGVLCKRRGFQE